MLRIVPHGLGQQPAVEQKLYCVRTGLAVYFPRDQPCRPLLSASELAAALPQGGNVLAKDLDREIWFYPTPQSVIDKLGLCGAIRQAYGDGFFVPAAAGTEKIEPGVFHYSKSWGEMVAESRALRAGTAPKWAWCQETAVPLEQVPITGVHGPGTLTLRNPDGSVKCLDPALKGASVQAAWTARLPSAYWNTLLVARTAAMWVASDSASWTSVRGTSLTESVTCGSDPQRSVASAWGHAYDLTLSDVATVGPGGAGPTARRRSEGPVLQVYVDPLRGPAKAIAVPWVAGWVGVLSTIPSETELNAMRSKCVSSGKTAGDCDSIVAQATGSPQGFAALPSVVSGLLTSALVDSMVDGQWINLKPSQVQSLMSRGQWPPPEVLKARWKDNGSEFDPRQLLGAPAPVPGASPVPTQQASAASTLFGFAGIIAGVVLIAIAMKGKRT